MHYIQLVKSAAKGKAPIVAVPVEGAAPVCIDRKRLAAWSKGVSISHVDIETHYEYVGPARGAEGPQHRLPGHRVLVIKGTAGRVRTSCRMTVIDRRTAVKTLGEWSEKERARQFKKVCMGALSKEHKKAFKLLRHDDLNGAGVEAVYAAHHSGAKRLAHGVRVNVPELPGAEVILHRSPFDSELWTVTERYTGRQFASDSTPESALVAARETAAKATPEQRAKVLATIEAARTAATV